MELRNRQSMADNCINKGNGLCSKQFNIQCLNMAKREYTYSDFNASDDEDLMFALNSVENDTDFTSSMDDNELMQAANDIEQKWKESESKKRNNNVDDSKHVSNKPEMIKFTCKECDKHYSTKRSLTRHILSHNRTFKCIHCGKQMKRQDYLKRHIERVHNNKSHKFACNHCDFHFVSYNKLFQHNVANHL